MFLFCSCSKYYVLYTLSMKCSSVAREECFVLIFWGYWFFFFFVNRPSTFFFSADAILASHWLSDCHFASKCKGRPLKLLCISLLGFWRWALNGQNKCSQNLFLPQGGLASLEGKRSEFLHIERCQKKCSVQLIRVWLGFQVLFSLQEGGIKSKVEGLFILSDLKSSTVPWDSKTVCIWAGHLGFLS